MRRTCINCKYVGSVFSKEGLVCGRTKDFKSVKASDTCDDFVQGFCERCGSDEISFNRYSPDDKPYAIRTEYTCKECGNFWYQDV